MKRISIPFFSGILSVVLLAAFISSAAAQPRESERGRGPRGDMFKSYSELNLSSDQEIRITELRTNHRKNMIDRRAELSKIRIDIGTQLRNDETDMQKVESLIRNQEAIRTDMQLARIAHWNEVAQILTPEQREIFRSRLERPGRFNERPERGRRGFRR